MVVGFRMIGLTNKIASYIVLPLLLLLAITIFIYVVAVLGRIARENRTYDRYNACVLSVPALERTQESIDTCYYKVQQDTNIHIKRYDRE